ncbi:uncharacterized protein BDR25DRAFT_390039 [Lindgomyces ingoldianus]|uniref:Uncharacterized protein n=1 Tax=Lindgomyces ingoldianus TaxID=673940 RepID=A0ACB6RF47_9PLEO|nr:uncharacterized protein BDR25DRAFT_390039 [Lindgomyces ingoldianus]KAF2477383.1 hypothetical protein BDR25DRAFT_390039 [Lindgomyces ingoldianus]
MLLHSDPTLTEVPDFSPEQLESLTRSVERKKQKLQDDIHEYIRRKQDELRKYERELLERYRSMEGPESSRDANERNSIHTQSSTPDPLDASPSQPVGASTDPRKLGPEETAKRTKHSRVHKREKELCGLVTPIFLPLLDASESPPAKEKKKKEKRKNKDEKGEIIPLSPPNSEQGSPSNDGGKEKEKRSSRSRSREFKMERGEPSSKSAEPAESKQSLESAKKSKRSTIKKSSLRHNTSKPRRKRVSLIIDDQIFHPSDNIAEPPLTSPTSETTASSASTSTTSLESTLDPQLLAQVGTPIHHEPVHHSLPLPMPLPSTSPTKHTGHTLIESPPALEYEPPKATGQAILEPSPPNQDIDIPLLASNPPIYADSAELAEETEYDFTSFVGGIDGSGVDDVDQAGSYGYPSSLGASYLESYMQNRPLSVRIAAAEKAELEEQEKQALIAGSEANEEKLDVAVGRVEDVDAGDGDEFMGSMDAV